jgi:hypothetical protein
MTTGRQYTWHTDPSHGWLAVPVADLCRLNIQAEISKYSYFDQGRGMAYLEEDVDAQIFINAADPEGHGLDYEEQYTDGQHPIRSLPRFNHKEPTT